MSFVNCLKIYKYIQSTPFPADWLEQNVEKFKTKYEDKDFSETDWGKILLKEIEIVTPEEKNKILYEFNNTKADYPKDKTIAELFEEQVEKTPNNIAVVSDKKFSAVLGNSTSLFAKSIFVSKLILGSGAFLSNP